MRKPPEKSKCRNFKRLEQEAAWCSGTVLLTWANPFSSCEPAVCGRVTCSLLFTLRSQNGPEWLQRNARKSVEFREEKRIGGLIMGISGVPV